MVPFKPLALAMGLAWAGAAVPHAQAAEGSSSQVPPERPHHVYLIGSLRVTQPWIDVADDKDGGMSAYLIVENRSDAPDRLTGASVVGAGSVAVMPTGSEAAATDQGLDVPPHGTLTLKPGGAHLVLRGLQGVVPKGPPVEGAVRFERAGTVHVSFLTDQDAVQGDDQTAPSDQKPVSLGQ